MKKGISPLFKWFGSKWLSAKTLPEPKHERIVEPFGGGAGYSLRHAERDVLICESDPHLTRLWPWLIGEATETAIRDIPINVPIGTDIRTLGLSDGQSLLLKNWQRTNNTGNCWTISAWGNRDCFWSNKIRARVAEEVHAIKHWQFETDGLRVLRSAIEFGAESSTWLIDPMYRYNYQYRNKDGHDYAELGTIAQSLPGQVVVCEAVCTKTGAVPNWLPFVHFGDRITSRRKATQNHHSKELIWTKG